MNEVSTTDLCTRFSRGEFVIIWDEEREVEGDFFLLAKHASPEKVNFLLKRAGGLLCVSLEKETTERLRLPLMVMENEERFSTNFTVTVNAKADHSSGISAADRANTIQLLGSPSVKAAQLTRPGHVFPLQAQSPAVRWGHTEAAIALAKKCEEYPAVLICEILNEKGACASREELLTLAEEVGCAVGTLDQLHEFLV